MPRKTRTAFVMELSARHRFPVDMLRYDCCFPNSSTDARKIEQSYEGFGHSESVEVVLVTDSENRPTLGRWASFGCTFKGIISQLQVA